MHRPSIQATSPIHLSRFIGILQRCYNPENKAYPRYGGRGITLDRSIDGFLSFSEYVNSLPDAGTPGYSLDRIDNDLGYAPGNLRWASPEVQGNNTRRSKRQPVFVSPGGHFGKLTILETGLRTASGSLAVMVRCACGNEFVKAKSLLVREHRCKVVSKCVDCARLGRRSHHAESSVNLSPIRALDRSSGKVRTRHDSPLIREIVPDDRLRKYWLRHYSRLVGRGKTTTGDFAVPWKSPLEFMHWVVAQPEHRLPGARIGVSKQPTNSRPSCVMFVDTVPGNYTAKTSWSHYGVYNGVRYALRYIYCTLIPGISRLELVRHLKESLDLASLLETFNRRQRLLTELAQPISIGQSPALGTASVATTSTIDFAEALKVAHRLQPGHCLHGFRLLSSERKIVAGTGRTVTGCVTCGSVVYQRTVRWIQGSPTKCLNCFNNQQRADALLRKAAKLAST